MAWAVAKIRVTIYKCLHFFYELMFLQNKPQFWAFLGELMKKHESKKYRKNYQNQGLLVRGDPNFSPVVADRRHKLTRASSQLMSPP